MLSRSLTQRLHTNIAYLVAMADQHARKDNVRSFLSTTASSIC
jgi:hypothetical protein